MLAERSADSIFSLIYYRFPGHRERQIDFKPNAIASKAFRLQQSVKRIAYADAAYFGNVDKKVTETAAGP